jgi:hypothetical protein
MKTQSENISCERITFLDKKYNLYNDFMFEKQLKPQCPNTTFISNKNLKNGSLESRYISKKSCIFEPTEPDLGLWERQFDFMKLSLNYNNQNNQNKLFNINTKMKSNQDCCNCP